MTSGPRGRGPAAPRPASPEARRARHAGATLLCALGMLAAAAAAAEEVGDALEASLAAQRAARESQARIDRLDDETRALREKERAAQWRALQLSAYAAQLEQEAAVEEGKREQLEAQLARIASTGTDLLPLLRRMVAELEAFIVGDLPFQQELRRKRIADLEALLDDPKRGSADKFRRVVDAYMAEVDYGHGLGTEDVELDCGSGRGPAVLLRVGRIGLYCLSANGERAAAWDRDARRWRPMEDAEEVRKGVAVARSEVPPALLELPVPAAAPAP